MFEHSVLLQFDVSSDQLKAVIKRVGNSLIAVQQELGGR